MKELIACALEHFNNVIVDRNSNAKYKLDDDPDKFESNYSLWWVELNRHKI